MINVLSADSYRGFSNHMEAALAGAEGASQPLFVGRVVWPDCSEPEDVVIKLYEANSCGVANETIGYIVNGLRGVRQPRRGGILLLSMRELPDFGRSMSDFIDAQSGLAICWITSLEQNSQPFRYLRRLSSFSRKQSEAFYRSTFCTRLASVDHVTGNNDRHEGNFLYQDDLQYLAIDQGCVGGGRYWHTSWPEPNPRNELALLAQQFLNGSQLAAWRAAALMEYESAQSSWEGIFNQVSLALPGLLKVDEIDTILEYMRARATGTSFATSCEKLI